MKDTSNLKAFISAVEYGEYEVNVSIMTIMISCLAMFAALVIDMSLRSIVESVIIIMMLCLYTFLLIRKKNTQIILFMYLQSTTALLSIRLFMINLSHDSKFFTCIVFLAYLSFLIFSCISISQVVIRCTKNYYSGKISYLPSVGLISAGGMFAYTLSKLLASIIAVNAYIISGVCGVLISCVAGYKGTELLVKHIIVCKYDLYDSIRTRSMYDRRL